MKPRDIGLVSRQTESFMMSFIIFALIVAVVVGAISYAHNYAKNSTMESFGGGGKLMFHGSYPKAPVVCLAGNKHVQCTAFSGA